MKTLIICTAMLASLLISTVRADMIPDIISTTAVYDVGVHTVALNTVVLPGAELRLTAGATVMFMTATSRLVVSGALHAVSATLTAQSLVTRWGGIVVSDGATAQLYQCTLERAGAFDMEPVTAYRAHCANSVISNCYATDSARNAFVFEGGNAVLWDNHATVTSGNAAFWIKGGGKVVWRSTHNTMNGTGFPGIYVDGLFTDDVEFRTLDGDRLYCNSVIISNGARIVFPAGAFVGFGFVNSQLELHDGARMEAIGTPGAPIVFTDYAEATNQPNRWAGLHFANATGILTYVTTQRAIGHTVSDGVLTLSNVCMLGRSGSAIAANRAVVTAYQSEFSGCVGRAVTITNFSTAFFRECIFRSNNPPYAASFYSDLSTRADVRFCWWNAADGPYPFGAYGNELVNTNADAVFFPWLLAAPGSQTNPPYVKITSQTEPFSTPAAQVIIQGIATDATRVVRLALRNDRCPITLEPAWVNATTWQAQIWLYAGANPIAVFAYDDEGNASVDAVLITCTGPGVGNGGTVPPAIEPLGTRHVMANDLLAFDVLATSPGEPEIMTYWAANLPTGASFDPVQRHFAWTPALPDVGVYNNVAFFVTAGGSVVTALCTIVVDTAPTPAIRAISTPDMYAFQPYFYMAAPDGTAAPLDWRFSPTTLPEGVISSRAGMICGIPLNLSQNTPLPFTVYAINAAGVASATVDGSINRYTIDTGAKLRVLSYDLPTVLAAAPLVYQFTQTNGLPPVSWLDANSNCAALGTTLELSGALTGAVAAAGMHPATILLRDASNRTCAANIVMPIVAAGQQLRYVPKKNSVSIMVNQNPLKSRKSSITLKAMFEAPASFTLTSNDLAACRVGFVLCDAGMPFKTKFNKKNLFIENLPTRYTKIQVNRMGNGMLKFSCTIKNADLRLNMAQYGIINENVPVLQATLPIWIQIGMRMTVLQQVPVVGKAKFNVFSKAKAKW